MAVRSKEELLAAIREYAGDDNGESVIAIIEDVSDTMDSYADSEDWKTRYEENDRAWRERYTARFTDAPNKTPTDEEVDGNTHEEEKEEIVTYDDFFKAIEED